MSLDSVAYVFLDKQVVCGVYCQQSCEGIMD